LPGKAGVLMYSPRLLTIYFESEFFITHSTYS
jgi:hypothetical protein